MILNIFHVSLKISVIIKKIVVSDTNIVVDNDLFFAFTEKILNFWVIYLSLSYVFYRF